MFLAIITIENNLYICIETLGCWAWVLIQCNETSVKMIMKQNVGLSQSGCSCLDIVKAKPYSQDMAYLLKIRTFTVLILQDKLLHFPSECFRCYRQSDGFI